MQLVPGMVDKDEVEEGSCKLLLAEDVEILMLVSTLEQDGIDFML